MMFIERCSDNASDQENEKENEIWVTRKTAARYMRLRKSPLCGIIHLPFTQNCSVVRQTTSESYLCHSGLCTPDIPNTKLIATHSQSFPAP